MRVGDVLEILAAAALVGGVYLLAGPAGTLLAAGVCTAYLAQVYSDSVLPWRRHRGGLTGSTVSEARGAPTFHCTRCGSDSPWGEVHECADLR